MNTRESVENELKRGINKFASRLVYLRNKSKKLSLYRLTLFFTALILFFYFFFARLSLPLYITVTIFLISFGILTGVHNKLESGIRKNILWANIKKTHIARMNLNWNELPPSLFYPDRNHPFEFDLDITGEYSLHRLISTAESFEGSKILKEWFTSTNPDAVSINERQLIIKELISLNRFRDKLSLYSRLQSKKRFQGTRISAWINTPSEYHKIKTLIILLYIIIPVNVTFFVLFLTNVLPAYFAFISLLYAAVY